MKGESGGRKKRGGRRGQINQSCKRLHLHLQPSHQASLRLCVCMCVCSLKVQVHPRGDAIFIGVAQETAARALLFTHSCTKLVHSSC